MKFPRRCRILFLIVGGLVVLWLIYYATISVIYGLKLRSLRAQVKAEGSSLNLPDLAPKPVPREENAARWYQAAGLVKYSLNVGRKSNDAPEAAAVTAYDAFLMAKPEERAKVVSERRADLDLWLDHNKLALQFLHGGAKYDRGYFELEYADGFNMRLPHLAELRDSARLLMAEAWLAAEQDDAHKALQATWAALRLRRAIEDEPILISYLVGIATDGIALRALQETMPRINPTHEDLCQIMAELQSRQLKWFRRAIEGERAGQHMTFDSVRQKGLSCQAYNNISTFGGDSHKLGPSLWLRLNFSRAAHVLLVDETFCLSYMGKVIEAAETFHDADESELQYRSFWWRVYHPLSGMFLPAYARSAVEARADLARRYVAECGIAAELYRNKYGAYPANMESLTPEFLPALPNDPFSGKPLLFKSLPNGVLIYSVGANEKDDGGVDDQTWGGPAPKSPADDIAWRVERPAPAQP